MEKFILKKKTGPFFPARILNVELETGEFSPVSAFFGAPKATEYPTLISLLIKEHGRGFETAGINFLADPAEGINIDEGNVRFWSSGGESQLPKITFFKILHDFAQQAIQIVREENLVDAGKLPESWISEMKALLPEIDKKISHS